MTRNRTAASVAGAIAALLLFYLVNPWVNPEAGSTLSQLATAGFWLSFIVLMILLFEERKQPGGETIEIEGPAFTRFLFGNSKAGLFWLPIRLFVGFSWLEAGWGKLTGGGWIDGGAALRGFWEQAVAVPDTGQASITYDWYRSFIQLLLDNNAERWFGWVITFGEIAVGIGLLLGILTGIAAFFGAFMNMSFMLAGSASTNPVMFSLAIGLMLAWKVAGYYGIDRYLLPILGTPWRRRETSVPGNGPAPGAPAG